MGTSEGWGMGRQVRGRVRDGDRDTREPARLQSHRSRLGREMSTARPLGGRSSSRCLLLTALNLLMFLRSNLHRRSLRFGREICSCFEWRFSAVAHCCMRPFRWLSYLPPAFCYFFCAFSVHSGSCSAQCVAISSIEFGSHVGVFPARSEGGLMHTID